MRLDGPPNLSSYDRSAHITLSGLNGAHTVGWQLFDPDSGQYLSEGDWTPVENGTARVDIRLPEWIGRYHVYVSEVDDSNGWGYKNGRRFLLMDAGIDSDGHAVFSDPRVTTLRRMRLKRLPEIAARALIEPVRVIGQNRRLISSMVRRDILARYRGSFIDKFWTILNPLLLMATYFFVFGVVLQSRFGEDASRTGFALYFLAGMLPWLPFAEAAGRAPNAMLEHRTFIKKVVFPVEIVTVAQTLSALVTQAFALAIFVIALFIARGDFATNIFYLPAYLVPQVLFTLGVTWFLAATGVFVRDLAQIIGFLLTLLFFITPICYPEASLPREVAPLLTKSPIYKLVQGYREILLDNQAPQWSIVWPLWALSLAVAVLGYAWYRKLRPGFADVL